MKVTGPGSGAPADGARPLDETSAKQPAGAGFAERLDRRVATQGPVPADGTAPAARVADIAADLKAGRITREAALERVIESVLDRQLGPHAPAAVREKLSTALRDALADDPLLAEKIAAL